MHCKLLNLCDSQQQWCVLMEKNGRFNFVWISKLRNSNITKLHAIGTHMLAHKSTVQKKGLYTYLVSHRSQGAGHRCDCVFLCLIKELCFVTHRILRSKSNTYYMRQTAGDFPTILDCLCLLCTSPQNRTEHVVRVVILVLIG